jgi:hypothetical protein
MEFFHKFYENMATIAKYHCNDFHISTDLIYFFAGKELIAKDETDPADSLSTALMFMALEKLAYKSWPKCEIHCMHANECYHVTIYTENKHTDIVAEGGSARSLVGALALAYANLLREIQPSL